jgi:hypothetical protein
MLEDPRVRFDERAKETRDISAGKTADSLATRS